MEFGSCPVTACVCISCRELDGLLVEQCTVDTDTTTGQSVPAVIGNYWANKIMSSPTGECSMFVLQCRAQESRLALTHNASFTIHK